MDGSVILSIVLAVIGSTGMSTVIVALLQRKWSKSDKHDAIVIALKVLMIDRVKYVGACHIKNKGITLDDKEMLKEMHDAYKALGGNGHLDMIMSEVNKLPIVD